MSFGFLLLLMVAMPCAYVIGVLVGYARGRREAEDDFAGKRPRPRADM